VSVCVQDFTENEAPSLRLFLCFSSYKQGHESSCVAFAYVGVRLRGGRHLFCYFRGSHTINLRDLLYKHEFCLMDGSSVFKQESSLRFVLKMSYFQDEIGLEVSS